MYVCLVNNGLFSKKFYRDLRKAWRFVFKFRGIFLGEKMGGGYFLILIDIKSRFFLIFIDLEIKIDFLVYYKFK